MEAELSLEHLHIEPIIDKISISRNKEHKDRPGNRIGINIPNFLTNLIKIPRIPHFPKKQESNKNNNFKLLIFIIPITTYYIPIEY